MTYERDENEYKAIEEIYIRHSRCEPMRKIYDDFHARKLVRPDGIPWAPKPPSEKRPRMHRFYRVYHWYKNEIVAKQKEEGK